LFAAKQKIDNFFVSPFIFLFIFFGRSPPPANLGGGAKTSKEKNENTLLLGPQKSAPK
jgi:hypothetical protein